MSRWGWTRDRWDQRSIVSHSCVTVDVVEEVLVLRLWDPAEPSVEVARISLDALAARKLGVQCLVGATASEWEHMARGLEKMLREHAARSAELLPEEEEVEGEAPLVSTGACATCGARAHAIEHQPDPTGIRWLAACGARWTVRAGLPEETAPCPRA